MDILTKLRLVFWTLVLALWGLFMFQFFRKDLSSIPKIIFLKNPFSTAVKPIAVTAKQVTPALTHQENPTPGPGSAGTSLVRPIIPEGAVPVMPEDNTPSISESHTSQERTSYATQDQPEANPQWPAAPDNFATAQTTHFLIYKEDPPILDELLSMLENLHGNLMLDLVSFSPWTRDMQVLVYMFATQKLYAKTTGRPEWSGGSSSISRRTIYVLEDPFALGILAHELTHIYFDSFFNASVPSPLWLSEGMAVFVQTERGQSPPVWLNENLAYLKQGGGFRLKDLMSRETLTGMDEQSVRLWYAESYSVVRFLNRLKQDDSFYRFCQEIRTGEPVAASVYRAYGMPFNRIAALEYAWRYDLKTHKITGALAD